MQQIPDLVSIGLCKKMVEFADEVLNQSKLDAELSEGPHSYDRMSAMHEEFTSIVEKELKSRLYGYNDIGVMDWRDKVYVHPKWFWTKYKKGHFIARHRDGRRSSGKDESFATILVYLTANFRGGETCSDFQTVTPVAGSAILLDQGYPHWSTPIEMGTKYIARSDLMVKKPTIATSPSRAIVDKEIEIVLPESCV